MNKNTLYITIDGLTDPLGQSQILPYLKGIVSKGYSISVLSCEKEKHLNSHKKLILSLIEDYGINWQYIIYDEKGGFFTRFLYIQTLKKMALKLHANKQFKLVHCRSFLPSLIGLKLKKTLGIPFLFDMRGFWADERFDGGIWKRSNLLHQIFYRYFKIKEKQFLVNADAVISLTNAGLKDLLQRFDIPNLKEKVRVIPCCVDTNLFDPSLNYTLPALNINKSDTLLIYTGSIGTWYYTREMIDCVTEFRKLIPSLKLLVLTKDLNEFKAILSSYKKDVSNYIFYQTANYKDIPSYLKMAHAAIFFIKPTYSKIASSPTKMSEYWAMNVPIITNKGIGDNDLYFKNEKGGILINSFDNEEYKNAGYRLIQILNSPKSYRHIAIEYFDTQKGTERYLKIYQRLSGV